MWSHIKILHKSIEIIETSKHPKFVMVSRHHLLVHMVMYQFEPIMGHVYKVYDTPKDLKFSSCHCIRV